MSKYGFHEGPVKEVTIYLQTLCNNNKRAPIRFAFVDYKGKVFNTFDTTVEQLMEERGKAIKGKKRKTVLTVDHFLVYNRPTFMEYLRSGWQISLFVGIDYTMSNGLTSNRFSLHRI